MIMRIWRVGILVLLLASVLWAQAEGTVESIGFQGYYRPECWVPMTVLLRPTSDSPAELQIRVVQEDIDRDRVLATRNVTLSPDPTGRQTDQRFWMYFRPQPTNDGLHDSAVGGSPTKLKHELKVVLTDRSGKTIAELPNTQTQIMRVDVKPPSSAKDVRGVRVVLCVTDGMSLPARQEYDNVDGLSEMPMFIVLRPRDLPEDVRGYEMVDSILWLGSTAPDPRKPTEEPRYRAIEQFVKQGGMLVVAQGPELAQTRGFEALLPVKVAEYRESTSLEPLPTMGNLTWRSDDLPEGASAVRRVALAAPKPDAMVLRSKQWEDKAVSPYLVRWRVGAGCVTWVAQDIGERSVVSALRKGWVRIWDEIMGWRNSPVAKPDMLALKEGQELRTAAFGEAESRVDVGPSFHRGGDLGLRASGYVLMAVLFFAVYWVVSGPGLYAFLSLKKMATLNWFLFGVAAVVAAVLATLVVRLIQTGNPRVEHVTILRVPAGENAVMQSRIGLYIPSDGLKTLQLQKTAPNTTNWITPYPEHPARVVNSGQFLAMKQYVLPIQDSASDEPVQVEMPWRSTMKRVQVRWNGTFEGQIEGQATLTGQYHPDIRGALVNATPWPLREVYLVYRDTRAEGDGSNSRGDRIIYIPQWGQGERIDLTEVLTSDKAYRIGNNSMRGEAVPRDGKVVYGGIEQVHRGFGGAAGGEGWASFWYARRAFSDRQLTDQPLDDSNVGYEASVPLCSLFDRIPPMSNESKGSAEFVHNRKDVLRVGARAMNVSPAVAAGSLVILAQAHGPLPVPLTVEGDTPAGDGVILCQFILPLGRPASAATATPAATQPIGGVEK